ncbi:MAG: YceI family protein [Ignavibacteriae bacterium]|nr:YceI family protein [Ignavibacteriota bacterium]
MNNYKQKTIYFLIAIAIFSVKTAYSSGFNLNLSGEKKFEINSRVNEPQIIFISDAPLEDMKGNVNAESISGFMGLDPSNIENSKGTVTVKVKGMETGIQKRNSHLYSDEWMDADKYPNITFNLDKITNLKTESTDASKGRSVVKGTATGSFSMHGKSKSINAIVTLTYIKESEDTKKRAPGDFLNVSGKFDVSLKDFNITGIQGLVGSKVGEVINIEFNLYYSAK